MRVYYETVVSGTLTKNNNAVGSDAYRNWNGSAEIWIEDNNLNPGATYQMSSHHRLDATYLYYQIVWECEPYCGWWGDKYGFSLIATGGPPSQEDEYYCSPGPPVPIETSTSIEDDQERKSVGDCNDLPQGDILYWLGPAYPTYINSWQYMTVGTWSQQVDGSSSSYRDRSVREVNGGVLAPGDTCWFQGSEIPKVTGFPNPTTWRVGYIQGQPAGNKEYGFDGVGWFFDSYIYYETADRFPCGVTMMQKMEMSCGFDWWRHYTSHEMYWGIALDMAVSGKDGWEYIQVR